MSRAKANAEAKASRLISIAVRLEREAEKEPQLEIVVGLRDLAARFRFNALMELHPGDGAFFIGAGEAAARTALMWCTREELKEACAQRFCMRCLGVIIVGVEL